MGFWLDAVADTLSDFCYKFYIISIDIFWMQAIASQYLRYRCMWAHTKLLVLFAKQSEREKDARGVTSVSNKSQEMKCVQPSLVSRDQIAK